MRDGIRVAAPCKINFHLCVLDRRDDGFHNLESVFQTLSFGDELRFESLKERFACDLRMPGSVPPEQNIVHKAVALFREQTRFDQGLRITVEKRIPLGAGLGGGSSDGAATLWALDKIAGTELPEPVLCRMAEKLGSDVPFFLSGATAFVGGRGEIVEDLDVSLGSLGVVLVNPSIHSDTKRVFGLLDASRESKQVPPSRPLGKDALERALRDEPSRWPFFNDFLPVLVWFSEGAVADIYKRCLEDLRSAGADFISLSGSGSTCFGVFMDQERAEEAVKTLLETWDFVHLTFPLARKGFTVVE
jgi:4-diphosphocytidyl-2-C-methyl-D-erythritol kinase